MSPLPCLAAALLVLAPLPAAAYPLDAGGFSDGTDASLLAFDPLVTQLEGPSLRLLTNSTVSDGSILIGGRAGYVNSTFQETSSLDFATYRLATSVNISQGTLSLVPGGGAITLEEANGFGAASFVNVTLVNGSAELTTGTNGTLTTDVLAAPTSGWGTLLAKAVVPSGSNLTVDVLAPNLTVLVPSQALGGTINLDPVVYPSLRLRLNFSAPSLALAPSLSSLSVGQAAGDSLVGSGVTRTNTNLYPAGGGLSLVSSTTSFSENPTSPYIPIVSGSYYSKQLYNGNILKVNGTWHLFAAVSSNTTGVAVAIGHATSTDFSNWTFDAAPVLTNASSGWDSYRVDHPWVLPDPSGSGYLMYYSGWVGATRIQTGLATSSDLTNWTKYGSNPVLSYSSSGWDTWNAGNGIVHYESGTYKMWYAGTTVNTGGGNSFGYATSSDGRNWTKHSGNPVMARGASGVDRDDAQIENVRFWNGTYYAYYACHNGVKYQGCLATSTDGTTWTKYSGNPVLTNLALAWQTNVVPNDVVIQDGRFTLFYHGWNSTSQIQIGRADANYVTGSAVGRVDFGSRKPLGFGAATLDAVQPSGTNVSLFVRSSADASTWTGWSNITSSLSAASTPGNRYLEWMVLLNGTVRAEPPVYRGIRIEYSAFASSGRYESSPFPAAEEISAASVTVVPAAPSGTSLVLELSNNNGTTWTRVTNATFTPFSLNGTSLLYALYFEGTTALTPVVDWVNLTVQRRAFPENVTVRLGLNGTPLLNVTGPFAATYNLTLPVGEMNAAIAAARAQFPNASSVDVPLIVRSSHYGVVELREPRYTQVLKNPLFATFTPPSNALSLDENTTAGFSVSAASYPSYVKVNTTWTFDGSPIPGTADQPSYNYTPDFFAAGNHTLRCDVENGDFALNRTWSVTVLNVNRPPIFTLLSPASPVTASHTATVTFSAQSTDPDLEFLAVLWRLDGRILDSGVDSVNLTGLSLGTHTLQVRVSDGTVFIVFNWTVVSTNGAPAILAVTPPGNVSLSHFAALALSVLASDGDADPLDYAWRLDGALVQNGSAASLSLDNLTLGVHFMSLSVSDPFVSASFVWAITSTNSPPALAGFDPAGDFSLSHTASRALSASATDADGEPLSFVWTLDGGPLTASGPLAFVANLTVGGHTVRLRVLDAYDSAEFTWGVTSTNAAPALVVVAAPADGEARSHTESVRLEVAASDADGDAIALSWTVNGAAAASLTGEIVLAPIGLGPVSATLRADDGLAATLWTWTATGTNAGPVVAPFGPATNLTVSFVDTTTFSAGATDPDGDPLTWRWSLDGALLDTGNTTFTVGPQPVGRHEVLLRVSDGLLEAQVLVDLSSVDLPPTFLAFDPVTNFSISHTARRTVSVAVSDHEGAPLAYRWRLDSLPLPEAGNATELRSLPPGAFVLRLEVSDGTNTLAREWGVEVTDSPPVVSGLSPPPGALSVNAFTDITFTARATDADGDPVALAWFDGNAPLNGTDAVTLRWSVGGVHAITLEVLAAGVRQTYNWTVTVKSLNAPPSVGLSEPNGSIVLAVLSERVAFAVGIEDDGLLPVNTTWYLDGVPVGQGTGFVFVPKSEHLGTHNLTVRVSDGEYSAERSWQLEIVAQRPVQQASGGEGTLLLVLLLGAAGAAAALVQIRRRRK